MSKRYKVLIVFALIGILCIFVIPKYGCDTANFYCPLLPYIAYASFGICGLILAFQLLKLLKRFCQWFADCCCDNCCDLFFRRRQEYLLRSSGVRQSRLDERLIGSFNQVQQNEQISHEPQDHFPLFYQHQQQQQGYQGWEGWEGQEGFRHTFNQQQCTICLQPYNPEDQIVRIKCGHKYHQECISDWLMKNQKCPNCRDNVF